MNQNMSNNQEQENTYQQQYNQEQENTYQQQYNQEPGMKQQQPMGSKAVVYDQMSEARKDGMAVSSFVNGIIALIFSFTIIITLICGIISIVQGIIVLVKRRKNHGLAIAGIVLSVLAMFAMIFFILVYIGLLISAS